jgi:hypothetical protein
MARVCISVRFVPVQRTNAIAFALARKWRTRVTSITYAVKKTGLAALIGFRSVPG